MVDADGLLQELKQSARPEGIVGIDEANDYRGAGRHFRRFGDGAKKGT